LRALARKRWTHRHERLPARIESAIREQQERAEVLIAWAQLAIVAVFAIVYALSPKTFPAGARFVPVPWVLTAYAAVTSLRLGVALRRALPRWFLAGAVVVDMALLMALIWSFHLQYMQPPAFYLKVPTLFTAFVFIALRTLRFEVGYVILAGTAAAVGWAALTLYAVLADGGADVTHDFDHYVMSNTVLVGAEVEKILAIGLVTSILALAIARARGLLVRSVADSMAARDLARFFAPEIAEKIRRSEDAVMAGHGEACEAAILSIDIRGFTPLAAALAPSELMGLLAEYQACVVPVVQRHGGAIDKFLGDGVMATFGCAPPSPAYAANALTAVDELLAAVDRWNAARIAAGARPVIVNCAVAAGRVIFGAVGDATRLEYTVIGDAVNLAAKLEKQNKAEGTRALCTAEAYARAVAQGYAGPGRRECRSARPVGGTARPLDIVVLA
jgi:adenylate cyclase